MPPEDPAEFLQFLETQGYLFPRVLSGSRWAAIAPFMFTVAIVTGKIGDRIGYDDRWCYRDAPKALRAMLEWNGEGEPQGWTRHPTSGRRVAESGEEYVQL